MTSIKHDGYVGIYARCGTLDPDRFEGCGETEDVWRRLFAYYFELWMGDRILLALEELVRHCVPGIEEKVAIIFRNLFDSLPPLFIYISQCRSYLSELRKGVDYAINNAAFTGGIEVPISLSRGKLFFDLPQEISSLLFGDKTVIFSYFLDEFESLDEDKQQYINTLVREKRGPASFKIGSRLYGVKTRQTLSGGEDIRQGAEFEELRLDERARYNKKEYENFARAMAAKRLFVPNQHIKSASAISDYFEYAEPSDRVVSLVQRRQGGTDLPHRRDFAVKLAQGVDQGGGLGLRSRSAINEVMSLIAFPAHPVIEKICILWIYQAWFRSDDLLDAAQSVSKMARAHVEGMRVNPFNEFYKKHKGDMIAQLLRENGQRQIYSGVSDFLRMSEGLPRNFLTILKQSYDWSSYFGEKPFKEYRASIRAQQRGVLESAEWFFKQHQPSRI